jgi:hypothetical protein
MCTAHVLPQGFSSWTDMEALQTVESTGLDMLRLNMGFHIRTLLRVEGTQQAVPNARQIPPHVILYQNIKP